MDDTTEGLSSHGRSPLGWDPGHPAPPGLAVAGPPRQEMIWRPPCHHWRPKMKRFLTGRRSFLATLSSLPYLGGLMSSNRVHGAAAVAARDVIKELGVRSFINAAGTFTALSGSLMPPEVMAAMQVASSKYVRLEDLHHAVGQRIAELLHCEAALVTAGCASALSLATAACVAGSDPARIRRIPDTTGMKNEVVVQKTHRVGYDHAIRNAGVRLIEVET